jgi:two-component system, OmpR family, phosphate regulon sensor histidine kinase PhoR
VRFPQANVQLRRAQLVLMLAVLVPTVLMIAVGIVILAVGSSDAGHIVFGVLVLTFCTTAITGYILGSIFLGRGASLARVQNDFLSSVSHELRTPLTSIGLFIESLRDGRLSTEQQQHVLHLLGVEMRRLDRLVMRLFELSRMESGAHVFERTRMDVQDLVRDALEGFEAATLARPTTVAVHIEPGLVVVGDRPMLARAVSNLLINAWKYTGDDKRIELDARAVGKKWIDILVRDNGIGILPEEKVSLFMEFSRSQRAVDRGTPGVGLGLAVVRAITRAHKGKVEVMAHEGPGSTFRLRLPRARMLLVATAIPADEPRRPVSA